MFAIISSCLPHSDGYNTIYRYIKRVLSVLFDFLSATPHSIITTSSKSVCLLSTGNTEIPAAKGREFNLVKVYYKIHEFILFDFFSSRVFLVQTTTKIISLGPSELFPSHSSINKRINIFFSRHWRNKTRYSRGV